MVFYCFLPIPSLFMHYSQWTFLGAGYATLLIIDIGSPVDFVKKKEERKFLTNIYYGCAAAAFIANGTRLFLLDENGTLLCLNPNNDLQLLTVFSGSLPITELSIGRLNNDLSLGVIEGGSKIIFCEMEGDESGSFKNSSSGQAI